MQSVLNRIKIVTHLFLPISSKTRCSWTVLSGDTQAVSKCLLFSGKHLFFSRNTGLIVGTTPNPLGNLKQLFSVSLQ